MIAVIETGDAPTDCTLGGSMAEWQKTLSDLKVFIEERCTLLDDGMVECYDLTGPYEITLLVETAGIDVGEIDFNTLDIEEFPWTGNYFGNMEKQDQGAFLYRRIRVFPLGEYIRECYFPGLSGKKSSDRFDRTGYFDRSFCFTNVHLRTRKEFRFHGLPYSNQ